jgi:hypothetical protein
MGSPAPEIGHWYQMPDGTLLEIVALEPDEGVVEVQFFDGTIEEYDLEYWNDMELARAAEPEDYSGSLDMPDLDRNDTLPVDAFDDPGSYAGFDDES